MISSSFFRTLTGVLGANAFNNLISFLIIMFAARTFGPGDFGKLSMAISITILFSLILDFGLWLTLVRMYNAEASPSKRNALIRAILGFKGIVLLVVVPLSLVLQELTVVILPIFAGYDLLVYLSFLSGGLLSAWITMRSIEQARRHFRSFERYIVIFGLLKLASFAAMYLSGTLSLIGVFISLYTLPLVGLLGYAWVMNYSAFWKASAHNYQGKYVGLLKQAYSYSVWVGTSVLCYVGLQRLPEFALARASNAKEVGLYGAALALITVLSLMNDALRTIILPDVTALRTSQDRRIFRKRVLRVAPVFFGIATLTLASMALMQYYVLGEAYSASIPVFLILGGSLVFAIYIGIFNTLVHSHGVPKLEATNNLGRIVVLAFLLFLLPKTAMFMSLAFALVLVAGEIRVYIVLRNKESDVSDVSAD